jgi:outer membrane protein TolC
MRVQIPFAIAAALALSCGTAHPARAAQAGDDTGCVTFDAAIALALARSPEVGLAAADAARAEADLRVARSSARPQLSTFLRTQAGDNNLTGAGLENSAGLRLSQRLFDFGIGELERKSATAALAARGFEVASAGTQAALDTMLMLVGLAEISARMEVTAEREAYFARERNGVTDALALGGATRSELAEIEARLADAAADRLELSFERDRLTAALTRQIGTPLPLCSGMLMQLDASPDPGIVEAVNTALTANPRLGAASLQLAAEEARAQRARRNRLPVIEIVGIASFARDNIPGGDFGLRERVGIDVTVPLITGGRLQADQQRSAADVQARSSELQRLRLDIAEQVEVAARRILSLRGQLAQREQVVMRQAEQFAAAESEFAEGLRTLPELVEDRLELEAVRIEAVAIRFALLREIALLQALTGKLPTPGSVSDAPAYGPVG